MKHILLTMISVCVFTTGFAQTIRHYQTTEDANWKETTLKMASKPTADVILTVDPKSVGIPFQAWGTTFNELDFDAFNLLTRQEQEQVMSDLYLMEICALPMGVSR